MSPFSPEDWLANRVRDRIHKRNLNALIGIFGPPGSGKTYCGMRLAELVDPHFGVERIEFQVGALVRNINDGHPRGSAFIGDDFGLAANARKWQSEANMVLSYLAQSFRFMGYLTIVTLPDIAALDSQVRNLFHLTLQTTKKDDGRQLVICQPRMPGRYVTTKKTYWKYPRVDIDEVRRARLKHVPFHRPSDALSQAYETKREEFMRALYVTLEEGLRIGGGSRTPAWAEKAVLELSKTMTQGEVGEVLGLARETVNRIIRQAKSGQTAGKASRA